MRPEIRARVARAGVVRWALVAAFCAAATAPVHNQASRTNAQGAAVQEFQQRLDAYIALRSELANKLEPLSETADAAELVARQEALAAALRTVRAGADQGNLIPPPVEDMIRHIVKQDLNQRADRRAQGALREVPDAAPKVNGKYPSDAALPTVPPLLLGMLPRLPDNLQYRFYGRHVVIIDGDVHMIVDYVENALPLH